VLENRQPAVVREVPVQAHAGAAATEDTDQSGLADLDGLAAQVRAVEFQQVEGIEEGVHFVAPAAENVELGEPALVAAHKLTVD
jgi:hypothetical protein